jgi:hypothetical protein
MPKDIEMARDSARQALVEAIEHYNDVVAILARLRSVERAASDAATQRRNAVYAAEQALEEARENQPADYVSALLSGTDPNEKSVSVAAAEDALRDAKRASAIARDGEELLKKQIADVTSRVRWANDKLNNARAELVKNQPAVADLIEEFDRARSYVSTIRWALDALNRRNCLPEPYDRLLAVNRDVTPDRSVMEAWNAALDALERDAYAPLPDNK